MFVILDTAMKKERLYHPLFYYVFALIIMNVHDQQYI